MWCAKLCTSLFATLQRFTDVEDVKFVINYDYPNSSEDYIHRIGRTARSTKTGTAYTFFTPNNIKQVNDLISVLREANQAINPKLLQLIEDRGSGKCCCQAWCIAFFPEQIGSSIYLSSLPKMDMEGSLLGSSGDLTSNNKTACPQCSMCCGASSSEHCSHAAAHVTAVECMIPQWLEKGI